MPIDGTDGATAANDLQSRLIAVDVDDPEWERALADLPVYDVYHLPEYHRLAQIRREGSPRALIYRHGSVTIVLPLLLRPIAGVPGLEHVSGNDATSVYGYAGPVASQSNLPPEVSDGFRTSIESWLRDLNVVCLFARLHPLLDQPDVFAGLGTRHIVGPTISIDLRRDEDQQRRDYRNNHRRDIRRLSALGAKVVLDSEWRKLDALKTIYRATMSRVNAAETYYFDDVYFKTMRDCMGRNYNLFLCELDGQVISAGLFSSCRGLVQYHLGGTKTEFLRLAPMKLVFDGVRRWACEQGAAHFHLGGGVGTQQDELFQFKRGFSQRAHDFEVWQWVLEPERYLDCCARTVGEVAAHDVSFFPRYRSPGRQKS